MVLAWGLAIGNAENVSGQNMTHFQAQVVNRIGEQQWHQCNNEKWGTTVTEEFRWLCKLEVPEKYEEDYSRLLAKHWQVFSLDKNDID